MLGAVAIGVSWVKGSAKAITNPALDVYKQIMGGVK